MSTISRIALALVVIGGINWGLIGFFQFDLVASIFGGQDAALARVVYGLVGLSALVCIGLLFMPNEENDLATSQPMRFSNHNLNTEFGKEVDFKKEQEAEKERQNKNNEN